MFRWKPITSRKPVNNLRRFGGTLEIVDDGSNGFITSPDAGSLAEAMDKLGADVDLARKMGNAGFEKLISMNINWDNVIERLTQ